MFLHLLKHYYKNVLLYNGFEQIYFIIFNLLLNKKFRIGFLNISSTLLGSHEKEILFTGYF